MTLQVRMADTARAASAHEPATLMVDPRARVVPVSILSMVLSEEDAAAARANTATEMTTRLVASETKRQEGSMEKAMVETGRRGLAAMRVEAARARISAGERAARGSLASRITEAVEDVVAQLLG